MDNIQQITLVNKEVTGQLWTNVYLHISKTGIVRRNFYDMVLIEDIWWRYVFEAIHENTIDE